MKGKDGFEMVHWIKVRAELKDLTTIVLSESQRIEHMKRSYDLRANSYLVKPHGFEKLLELEQLIRDFWLKC